jgi:hypothetical protein
MGGSVEILLVVGTVMSVVRNYTELIGAIDTAVKNTDSLIGRAVDLWASSTSWLPEVTSTWRPLEALTAAPLITQASAPTRFATLSWRGLVVLLGIPTYLVALALAAAFLLSRFEPRLGSHKRSEPRRTTGYGESAQSVDVAELSCRAVRAVDRQLVVERQGPPALRLPGRNVAALGTHEYDLYLEAIALVLHVVQDDAPSWVVQVAGMDQASFRNGRSVVRRVLSALPGNCPPTSTTMMIGGAGVHSYGAQGRAVVERG